MTTTRACITMLKDHTCEGCGEKITGNIFNNVHFILPPQRLQPLVSVSQNHMHLHDVTILHAGEEKLIPTIRRTYQQARRRCRWAWRQVQQTTLWPPR